jgi:sugar O-acyltransferase (sialic acid O-acetyltransferase NeuD family)
MTRSIVILGAGGMARDTLDVVEARIDDGADEEVLGFLVDAGYGAPGSMVNGKPILGDLTWLRDRPDVEVVCAIGAPADRRRVVERVTELGAKFCTLVHPRAIVTKRVVLGAGVIVTAGVILANNIEIGDHAILNLGSTIGHDGRVGAFVTVAPGAHLNGNVSVGAGTYVGTGASVIEKTKIGEWAVVGVAAGVVRDVPSNATVIGNPAHVLLTREPGWHLTWTDPRARRRSARQP